MWTWIRDLDRILRGEATRLSSLREGKIVIPAGGLTITLVLLGVFYGFCMGWFALFNREIPEVRQVFAAMLKVPALFFLTLFVTFPSLYVFNALVGSRLTMVSLLRLLLAAMGVTLAVLASFGTIVAFFSLTTKNYPFMVLLNVLIFAASGFLGLLFLLQTLHRLTISAKPAPPTPPAAPPLAAGAEMPAVQPVESLPFAEPEGALERTEGHVLGPNVKTVFYVWVVVFGLVGAQMSWVLRPFIGYPGADFTWFRARGSHFFEAVAKALRELFL